MSKIDSRSKSLRELLDKKKYAIDYYQREYRWGTKHIEELLEDLEVRFLDSYNEGHEHTEVENYAHYFLGSIVINHENGKDYLIDGQQRLTSLTLLLIYLYHLHNGQEEHGLGNMIFATKFGKKNFNLEVPERTVCLEALYTSGDFDATGQTESVQNMAARYADIEQLFPETLKDKALPYFTDWLIENVDLVVITAYSDDDAYTIFETMNDRGLSLSPTDMLKGYLLANVDDPVDKARGNEVWKERTLELMKESGEDADFFKAWLRAKYADTIRERKRDASNEDFEKIGTEFHKWVKDEKARIELNKSADFRCFVEEEFVRFSEHYIHLRQAAQRLTPELEYVFYNAHNNFTLQYPLVLAPVKTEDDLETVDRKIRLVAGYIDIFIARRVVNFRTLGYSSIVYTMFNLMKKIRNKNVHELAEILKDRVNDMEETFEGVRWFHLHQQNRRHVHHLLARMTRHVEEQSGIESSFESYVSRDIEKPYEIEHIWADKYERHTDEFATEQEFAEYRNKLGNLILLPRGFNQSFGSDIYKKKVEAYFGQNLLAQSLNERCYRNNPSFLDYVQRSGLPFKPHPTQFKKSDLDARQELYQQLCEEIWSPARFDREL
jgi:hypothetical protein